MFANGFHGSPCSWIQFTEWADFLTRLSTHPVRQNERQSNSWLEEAACPFAWNPDAPLISYLLPKAYIGGQLESGLWV